MHNPPVSHKAIVILGMHRSGTSLITRGMHALGVDLGNNLLAGQEDNPKGFWEDLSLLDLSERVLNRCGLNWYDVQLLQNDCLNDDKLELLVGEAIEIIQTKFISSKIWGFKNPRTCRLLPFWRRVFDALKVELHYVIAVRDPLSVAYSLHKRDGLAIRHGLLMWLEHMLPAIISSSQSPRIFIHYDKLIESPAEYLIKIAEKFEIQLTPDIYEQISDYAQHFVDSQLRHKIYSIDEIMADENIPTIISEMYSMLLEVIEGERDEADMQFKALLQRADDTLKSISPILEYIDLLVNNSKQDKQSYLELQGNMRTELQKNASEQKALKVTISDLQSEVKKLHDSLKNQELLQSTLAKYEKDIHDLKENNINHLIAIEDMQKGIASREEKILLLEKQIIRLTESVHKEQAARIAIETTKVWRVCLWMRAFKCQLTSVFRVDNIKSIRDGANNKLEIIKFIARRAYAYYRTQGFWKTLVKSVYSLRSIMFEHKNKIEKTNLNLQSLVDQKNHHEQQLTYSACLSNINNLAQRRNSLVLSTTPEALTNERISSVLHAFCSGYEIQNAEYNLPDNLINESAALIILDGVFSEPLKTLICRAQEKCLPVISLITQTLNNIDVIQPSELGLLDHNSEHIASNPEILKTAGVSDFVITTNQECLASLLREGVRNIHLYEASRTPHINLSNILSLYQRRYQPKFSIVSILYGKERELPPVLASWCRQTYRGPCELIFVNDDSPDDSSGTIKQFMAKAEADGLYEWLPSIRVINNESNMGNCISRNRGIQYATGDIIIVMDADCMVNKDFLSAHAEAMSYADADVTIGAMNLETHNRDPLKVLHEYENDINAANRDAKLQDLIYKESFLNCITRNFAIRRDLIQEELFDPDFSYTADPASGFGWEDVEMGYRLYKRGLRVKYIENAISVHVTHPSSGDEATKPIRSLRNFRKLFIKHPELAYVARKWSVETYQKIVKWAAELKCDLGEDGKFLDKLFREFSGSSFYIKRCSGKRILTYRWHVPHQYEIYKLPHEFTLVNDAGTGFTHDWEYSQRPLPKNVKFASIRDIDINDYDMALLHFDENVLAPELTNGVIGGDWGATFKWFMENVHLPKVAVCHGTPQFYGQYNPEYTASNLMEVIEEQRQRLVDYLGETLVVNNSYQAQLEWQYRNSRVIWHGFDPAEFPICTREKGILTPYGVLMKSRPHYRGYNILKSTLQSLRAELIMHRLIVLEPKLTYSGNRYAVARYRNYIDSIRKYSIYFNPTIRSPMPRSRGEAMLCGLVNVSLNNHDVDLYIKNGVDGFYGETPEELGEYLRYLVKNPTQCRRIGIQGRHTAMNIFNHDRFLMQWNNIITELTS